MLNKKRLIMMAVAASMVLPNNLVYLATNTPVLAIDENAKSLEATDFSVDDVVVGTAYTDGAVKCSNTDLTAGTDYEVDTDSWTVDTVGENKGSVTVKGLGDYAGATVEVKFNVTADPNAKSLEATDFSVDDVVVGTAYTDGAVKCSNTDLTAGTDYEVDTDSWTVDTVGENKGSVTVKGLGDYAGATVEVKFNVTADPNAKSLEATDFSVDDVVIGTAYTDGAVKCSNTDLTAGTDYEVDTDSWTTDTAGENKGSVTVKGKGDYIGSIVEVKFNVTEKQALSDATVSFENLDLTQLKNGSKPAITCGKDKDGNPITVPADSYTATYNELEADGNPSSTATAAGELKSNTSYQVTIEADPNKENNLYTGFTTATFYVDENGKIELEKVTVTVPAEKGEYDLFGALSTAGGSVTLKPEEIGADESDKDGEYTPNYSAIEKALNDAVQQNLSSMGGLSTYTFKVEAGAGSEEQKDTDAKISLDNAVIKIKLALESKIRLLIPKASPQAQAALLTLNLEVANVVTKDDNVVIEDTIENIEKALNGNTPDGKITKAEIEAYLTAANQDLKEVAIPDNYEVVAASETKLRGLDEVDEDGFCAITVNAESSDYDPNNQPPKTPINNGGNKKPSKPKPEEPATPVVGTPTPMYRLYNKLNGEHLFTTDKAERDNLLTSDTWSDEGQGWTAPSVSDTPVYRLLNPNTGDHHYTTDKNEFDTLPSYGWVAEGIAFFSADKDNTENVILHRLYNPNAKGAGSHHYTADTNERDTLVAQGWKYEGTAWAGLPAGK